jgi:lysophospholipase L1-like esterase
MYKIFIIKNIGGQMKRLFNHSLLVVLLSGLLFLDCATFSEGTTGVQWISLQDKRLVVCGLPWFDENYPHLWRLPSRAKEQLRKPLWDQAVHSSGGRICFKSNTSTLRIFLDISEKVRPRWSQIGSSGLSVYVNNVHWHSLCPTVQGERKYTLFENAEGTQKDITIYLPLYAKFIVKGIGIDSEAELSPPSFRLELPLVFYGSSIVQGNGASRPSMTYPAIIARRMDADFINLGFGGNGIAEKEVVDLINEIDACCYIFDLGKSFRKSKQPYEDYLNMLKKLRDNHPDVPLICITPIYSIKEAESKEYRDISERLRNIMRDAGRQCIDSGDKNVIIVEGLELIEPGDHELFQDNVHPNDSGYMLIANKLQPIIEKALSDYE